MSEVSPKETVMIERPRISLHDFNGEPIDFRIDRDGDLCIDNEDGDKYFYLARADIAKLRDFLNTVLT